MDEEEDFKKQIKIMEKKIDSIKTGIEAFKMSNKRNKQKKDLNDVHHITNSFKDSNLFNKHYTTFQTTQNSMYKKYHYKTMMNTIDSEKPLNLKGTCMTHNNTNKHLIKKDNDLETASNFSLLNKGAIPLRKKILDKERYKSFDNITNNNDDNNNRDIVKYKKFKYKNPIMLNYQPLHTSNNSCQRNKFSRTIRNNSHNNKNDYSFISSNSNNDSIANDSKHNAMITKYNTTMNPTCVRKRSHMLYTSTQETTAPLNYNTNANQTRSVSDNSKSHNKLYNELKRLTKENNYEMNRNIEDNESEENVEKNEELIINEYKRVIKENKEKDILINKAIALYEASTGQIVNDSMNLQHILFDWIKEMSS